MTDFEILDNFALLENPGVEKSIKILSDRIGKGNENFSNFFLGNLFTY